jgi:hypothetical protein
LLQHVQLDLEVRLGDLADIAPIAQLEAVVKDPTSVATLPSAGIGFRPGD